MQGGGQSPRDLTQAADVRGLKYVWVGGCMRICRREPWRSQGSSSPVLACGLCFCKFVFVRLITAQIR